MHWEAKALAAKDFLKEIEFMKGLDIANAVDEALVIVQELRRVHCSPQERP